MTAAELLPDVADAQIEAGSLLLLAGKFTEAKGGRTRRCQDANNVRARVLLGNATAGLKDIDAAIKEFEEAIRLDPQQSGIYTGLASLKASQGDRDAAERIFKQAIAADPAVDDRAAGAGAVLLVDRTHRRRRSGDEGAALAAIRRAARVNVTLGVFLSGDAARRRRPSRICGGGGGRSKIRA